MDNSQGWQALVVSIDALTRAVYANNPNFSNNKYKFRATKTSAQNSVAAAFTKILMNIISFDTSAGYDATTNYRYVAQVAGYYDIVGRVQMGVANATIVIPAVYKNGIEVSRGTDHRVLAASRGEYVTDTVYLAVGDYIEIFLFCDVAIALDLTTSALNYFTAHLLSQS